MTDLPTFLIIGAMKGGTTALHEYLALHPQVFMSAQKELNFFLPGEEHDLDWYRSQFADADGALARGESSPRYTSFPRHNGIPERIAQVLPDVRLIYLVRDPIERIRSHFLHLRRKGREHLPIERAVTEASIYVSMSRYALQVDRFLERFSRDQLMIVRSEALRYARQDTLRAVYGFLGVEEDFTAPEQDREVHVTGTKREPRTLVPGIAALPGRRILSRVVPRPLKGPIAGMYRKLSTRPVRTDRAEMSDALRDRIRVWLQDDVVRLRAYLPRNFDGWGIA